MRRIEPTNAFKRDFKREAKGPYRATLESDFAAIFGALANDQSLAERYRDHALTGNWKDRRVGIDPDFTQRNWIVWRGYERSHCLPIPTTKSDTCIAS